MAVPRSRLLDLTKAQCKIFSTTFNPDGLRLGNKILRQRLKGPALAAYYPRKMGTLRQLTKQFPGWEFFDEEQEQRLDILKGLHSRGKTIIKGPKVSKTPGGGPGSK